MEDFKTKNGELMKKVILTRGLPASGKTTWAKKIIKDNPGSYKRVNKDDLRELMDSSYWSKNNEKFILKMRDFIIIEALKEGYHVIVDDTNLHDKHYTHIKQMVNDEFGLGNIQVDYKDFNISIDEAIQRDLNRPNSVGEKVIRDMYNKFILPQKNSTFNILYDPSLPEAIIVDVDGTIADKKGLRGPFEWEKVGLDKPKKEIIKIVQLFHKEGYKILFLSGREDVCYNLTKEWIQTNTGINNFELYMRKEKDPRKDSIVKKELFVQNIYKKYNINFVLDDRDQVVEMWRKEIGLSCLQVDYGNF